jgi:hypothetical protein
MIARVAIVRILLVAASLALPAPRAAAADQWIELKSPHFVLTSNASEGTTRKLAWQLEQIRSAIGALWPWAKLDLNKPLSVIVLRDEPAMKAMAPKYWEAKGGVRPATVWVGAADQNYLAVRADIEVGDTLNINPYVTSYFSYVSLILQQSLPRQMPFWFTRGLAGVISNTIVRDAKIMLGPPIPWHLERLREGARLKIPALLRIDGSAPEYRSDEGSRLLDAESWAFVHYLMFGEGGVRWPKLDAFAQMVASGTAPDAAFREALGNPEDLESPFGAYLSRNLFSFRQVNVDVTVKREGFTTRPLPAADAAARRALFHAAMNRPIEARTAIAEARQAGDAADASVAEALLLDREGKTEEARAAYTKAVEGKTGNPYAYYRLALLLWRDGVDDETLTRVEKLLSQAVALNTRFAAAYSMIGQARAELNIGEPLGMVLRAIALDPVEPQYRLAAANVLMRQRKYDDALKHAQAAAALADTDEERRRATATIDRITRAKGGDE